MSFTCRLIRDDEFNENLQSLIMKTFFQYEPMNQHLNCRIPDDIDRLWLDEVLLRAKQDQLSLAFYQSNDEENFPIAYAINHENHENQQEDLLYNRKTDEIPLDKHQHISELISKLHENVNLFEEFHCKNILHIYLLGVDPIYRQNRLASQLIEFSIHLAKEKHFDLIYADTTSHYSFNAFFRHGFQVLKTIDYRDYQNSFGQRIFQNMQIHQGCSIVFKDLRK